MGGGGGGGGRLHAYLNRIKQSSTGILKEGDRMKYIMKTAITQNAPELRTIVPSSKKKKKKKEKEKEKKYRLIHQLHLHFLYVF